MKKLLFPLFMVCAALSVNAQQQYTKRPAIGVHFFLNDFKSPSDIRSSSVNSVLTNKSWAKPRDMSPGLAATYMKGLSNYIDVQARLAASFLDLPVAGRAPFNSDYLLLEGDASVHLKMLPDKYYVTPYLSAGIGASNYKKGYYGAFMPLGVGLQINFFDDAFIMVNSQYRVPVTGTNNYHLFNSIGVAGNIGKKKLPPPPPPVMVEVPKDSDGDGIFDKDDACPSVAGTAKYNGCPIPDTDGDGINDDNDQCKDKPGTAKYNGCPVPDSDGDGLNDEEDKCPNQAGTAKYNGCPIPDGDGDGINDEEDKCPNVAGIRENQGCPEIKQEIIEKINYAAKNIFFATGSAKLLPKSFKPLNEVAKILGENADLKLNIEGHTDNTGKVDKNQALSQSRAEAVVAYLKSKGVDDSRLTGIGYGQDQPVEDNKTPAGRAKNRRVEMKIRNF
jgi:OmpA-OmpF porin, OOP family